MQQGQMQPPVRDHTRCHQSHHWHCGLVKLVSPSINGPPRLLPSFIQPLCQTILLWIRGLALQMPVCELFVADIWRPKQHFLSLSWWLNKMRTIWDSRVPGDPFLHSLHSHGSPSHSEGLLGLACWQGLSLFQGLSGAIKVPWDLQWQKPAA